MNRTEKISSIVSVAIIVYGFVSVTQAGQDNIFQNDGYGVFRGLMILAGGLSLGRIVGEVYARRSKK